MESSLRTVERLLRRHDRIYEANLAAIAAEAAARDPDSAHALLVTDEWWGDSDSIAAVDLALSGGFTPKARQDGQTLRAALLEILDNLQAAGYADDRMELFARQFRKWAASRM